jgi:Zn-dependent protease
VLLAVIADRAGDDRYLPDVLLEHARAETPAAAPADAAPLPTQVPSEKRRVSVGGFLVLLAKLGSKLAKGIPLALKTFKPGLVLVSGALYGVLFSWQFAIAIMIMLAFHEYGHVHAMRRAGLQVRGIYFIPLLGAAAVTEDTWRSRAEQARIALAGPIWGLGLTLVAAAVDAATGYAHPFLGVIVAWWALVNLFNLLPVNPLDGGRVLAAIGYSLHSSFGVVLSASMFVAALVLAWAFDITLLAIVGAIGLLEFVGEVGGALRFRRLTSSSRIADLSPAGLATLKGLARPSLSEEADQAYFHFEMRQASRLRQLARVTPMTRGQAVRWGIAYAVVAAALLALMVLSAGAHPDAALAREILR